MARAGWGWGVERERRAAIVSAGGVEGQLAGGGRAGVFKSGRGTWARLCDGCPDEPSEGDGARAMFRRGDGETPVDFPVRGGLSGLRVQSASRNGTDGNAGCAGGEGVCIGLD